MTKADINEIAKNTGIEKVTVRKLCGHYKALWLMVTTFTSEVRALY